MKNLLSIVTITKDDPRGLTRTLASAVAFRRAGAEHVIVDGSACHQAPVESSEVTVLRRPAGGIADALNAGVSAASGEWLWCLNGGDSIDVRLTPDFLAALLANSGSDVIIGATTYAGEPQPRPHPPVHLRWPPFRSWIPHPSTLVRRRLFERFGLFDERYTIAMDYEWWLRVIPSGVGVDVISVPLAVFAPGGISQQSDALPRVLREQHDAMRRHRGAVARSWASVSARLWRALGRSLVARRLSAPSLLPSEPTPAPRPNAASSDHA